MIGLTLALVLDGARLYGVMCSPCHGDSGDGRGPAAHLYQPPPRDFTRGEFKWRSTGSGQLPTEDDLVRTIRRGIPGTSMAPFSSALSEAQTRGLAKYVLTLVRQPPPDQSIPLEIGEPPSRSVALVDRGRELWNRLCVDCHGPEGRGDGKTLPHPYDLTAHPPRGGGDLRDLFRTLSTGLNGTAMPSFVALPPEDRWALAYFQESFVTRKVESRAAASETTAKPYVRADWYWRRPVPPQGAPPAHLSPAEASLWPQRCGKCHEKQFREWSHSGHSDAFGPGFWAQLPAFSNSAIEDCQSCHAPMTEQLTHRPGHYEGLEREGIVCAACHLRDWTRHGPRDPRTKRRSQPGYPLRRTDFVQRAEFCAPCHQHEHSGPGGKPLLDTFREWAESPYLARGIQCQSCHMPDGEHTWKGVHDVEAVRQALAFSVDTRPWSKDRQRVELVLTVENRGAGHAFPTTPTPEAVLRIWLEDARGGRLSGSLAEHPIGRRIRYSGGEWLEIFDTRILPGQPRRIPYQAKRMEQAARIGIEMRMYPDKFYEGFYQRALQSKHSKEATLGYREALRRAKESDFMVWRKTIELAGDR